MSEQKPILDNPFLKAAAPLVLGAVPPPPPTAPIAPQSGPTLAQAAVSVPVDPRSILMNRQDKRADLLWGASKTGKGFNAFTAILWMAQTYKKKSLYFTAEPGSIHASVLAACKAGLADMFILNGQEHLLAVLSTVLEGGKWPVYLKRGDEVIRDFMSREANCNPDEYGLLIVDSMESIAEEILRWLANPANAAKLPMTPGKDKFHVADAGAGLDSVDVTGGSPTHVGFASDWMQRMVVGSAALPYQKILWISREKRGARGEKRNKDGDIVIHGEPMYGPSMPGNATPRITSWFGGSYHTMMVPLKDGGIKEERADVGGVNAAMGGFMMPNVAEQLTTIRNYEYRLYLRPHPDPITGLYYDAGNRLESYINADPKVVPPFIVCTERVNADGSRIHTGLNTIWEIERTHGVNTVDALRGVFSEMLEKFSKR